MNKQQVKMAYACALSRLEELGAGGPAILGAGGSLVMHGLREETSDLDLEIAEEAWDALVAQGAEIREDYGVKIIALNGHTDLHELTQESAKGCCIVEGVLVQNLHAVLRLKQRLDRPKDQADIAKIIAHLR